MTTDQVQVLCQVISPITNKVLGSQPVEVITDSKFVANGIAAIYGGASPRDWAHADLWERMAPYCGSRFLIARWVKGTLTRMGRRLVACQPRTGSATRRRTGWPARRLARGCLRRTGCRGA